MNPRGKHFIDAVDPEENSQENTLQQQVSDVAEPASTQPVSYTHLTLPTIA